MKNLKITHNAPGTNTSSMQGHATGTQKLFNVSAYVLSFIMAVSPLVEVSMAQEKTGKDTAKVRSTVADTTLADTTLGLAVIEFEGRSYRPYMLSIEGYTRAYNDDFAGVIRISRKLFDNGYAVKGKRLLVSLYNSYSLDVMNSEELLEYAEACEEMELYGIAGWAYKRLRMLDKAEECFKKDTERILKEIDSLGREYQKVPDE